MKRLIVRAGIAMGLALAILGWGSGISRCMGAPSSPIEGTKTGGTTANIDPAFYDYAATAPLVITEAPYPAQYGMSVIQVTFPSPVTSPYPINNQVTAYLCLPPGPGPHPAMIVLHEWNASTLQAGFRLCQAIVRADAVALLIVEPYSLNRRPRNPHPPDAEILSGNVMQMVSAMRQAVLDARRGLDYLTQRPDIDPQRLGISGISLGGVLSGITAGVDPRVKVVMTLVGGADFADGFWNGLLTRQFRGAIRRQGYSFETFRLALAPLEATYWLKGFNPKNALLFNGRYDLVIFPKQAQALSQALGGARIIWANTGHYGMQFSAVQAGAIATRFLRSRFFGEELPFQPPHSLPAKTIKLGLLAGGQEGVSPALAYTLLPFDEQGRYSIDAQLTLHGLAGVLSARLGPIGSIGMEFPIGHGTVMPRPFLMLSLTL